MANMSSRITDQQAYAILSQERKCILRRDRCNNMCEKCECHVDSNKLLQATDRVLSILKARCPELHLMCDLQEIAEALEAK